LILTYLRPGSVSQWGEVSKPKKTSRTKAKDTTPNTTSTTAHESGTGHKPARGGRNVSESGRGRGRATDRGGRPARGRSAHATTNGTRHKENEASPPAEDSNAWATAKSGGWGDDGWGTKDTTEKKIETPPVQETPKPAVPQGKTWASMLRQSTAPKPAPKPKEAPAPKPVEPEPPIQPAEPVVEELEGPPESESEEDAAEEAPAETGSTIIVPEIALPPSTDQLTEVNLEQVADDSQPAATGTAASTAADSWDPRTAAANTTGTPLSASQQQHQGARPPPAIPAPSSGFATTALKATTGRSQSYQRRILDQEEAVRMPGHREVEKAAVQFGAFNLGEADDDVDGDREEAETRTQPPEESPIAHPRTSLPPVALPSSVPETFPPQKAPTPAAPAGAPTGPAVPAQAQAPPSAPTQPAAAQQFGRYGQGAQDSSFSAFSQQGAGAASSQQQYDNFQSQQTQQTQPPTQPSAPAYTSAQNDFNSYYTADAQNRGPYNSYYAQQFGQQQQQQAGQGQETMGTAAQPAQPQPQQRAFSGYNNSQADLSQYPQSGSMHTQARFGVSSDSQNSGHTTPNPPGQAQQGQQQQQQQQQQPGAQGSQPQAHGQQGGYQYNNPYSYYPYYQNYYGAQYGPGYGGPYGGKGGMHSYNMPPQGPFDHNSSPAAGFGAHGSLHRDNSGLSSGLGDFARGAQSQSGLGGNSFGSGGAGGAGGSAMDAFNRAGFNQAQTAGAASAANDDLKPFDAKGATGPSPALGGARPGSATNNAPAAQTGLPPQSGYGGYPGHLQHGLQGNSQYGMAGAGSGQHTSSPYGSYNQSNFGGSGYYGSQQRQGGGWSGNYNHSH